MDRFHLKELLERKVLQYNDLGFIEEDPISIPHRFSQKGDIEIAGFFAAVFSWGQRRTILQKSRDLLRRMDDAPLDFVRNHQKRDLKKMEGFVHRTFQKSDLFYFLRWLQRHYRKYESLEAAFQAPGTGEGEWTEQALNAFYQTFFSLPGLADRTRKHLPCPQRGSSCKRINMFLRWMVRRDRRGVDFGIWQRIEPAVLICPLDVHVGRVARSLGLLHRSQSDWKAAMELTGALRLLDHKDPVKYDFALFGMGIDQRYA